MSLPELEGDDHRQLLLDVTQAVKDALENPEVAGRPEVVKALEGLVEVLASFDSMRSTAKAEQLAGQLPEGKRRKKSYLDKFRETELRPVKLVESGEPQSKYAAMLDAVDPY